MAKTGTERQRDFVAKMKAEGRVRTPIWLTKAESDMLAVLGPFFGAETKQDTIRAMIAYYMGDNDKDAKPAVSP
jgi:hypothetical protein